MKGLRLTVSVIERGGTLFSLEIDRLPFTIGASPHNDVVLDDPYVSREHAQVLVSRGKLLFNDRSTNGSFFKGERFQSRVVDSGDVIEIPPFAVSFEYELSDDDEDSTAMRPLAEIMTAPSEDRHVGEDADGAAGEVGQSTGDGDDAPLPAVPQSPPPAEQSPQGSAEGEPDEPPTDRPTGTPPIGRISGAAAMGPLGPPLGSPPTMPMRRPTMPMDMPEPADGTVHLELPDHLPEGDAEDDEEGPQYLEVLEGPEDVCGEILELPEREITIGRGERADLRFEIENISRAHVRLLPKGEGMWLLKDLASLNGTYVDGRRITECTLRPGQAFRLANSIAFRLLGGDSGEG
jgi:pSer/pThr/pTyr-binding forkhead associated (FHA) protein